VLPENSVVSLRLVKHLLADLSIQVLEESENFPDGQSDSLLFQHVLKEFRVYSLLKEETCWLVFDRIFFLFAFSALLIQILSLLLLSSFFRRFICGP
jgi:hypothetical protein